MAQFTFRVATLILVSKMPTIGNELSTKLFIFLRLIDEV